MSADISKKKNFFIGSVVVGSFLLRRTDVIFL